MNIGSICCLDSTIFYKFDSDAKENYSDLPLNKPKIIPQDMVIHVSKPPQEASLKFDIE